MYADDTHLTYFAGDNADSIQSLLNQDLEKVHNWLRANKLTLNINMTKCEFILIGSRQRLCILTNFPTLSINDVQVSQVTTAKSLGVIINDKLNWSSHFEKLKPATHLAILCADRGEFDRQRKSQAIFATD